jgi:hypothetical protein
MSDIYVMQRANGDVFALDNHGRFRVPLFKSSRDAFLARLRNFEMLVYKPVQLDAVPGNEPAMILRVCACFPPATAMQRRFGKMKRDSIRNVHELGQSCDRHGNGRKQGTT